MAEVRRVIRRGFFAGSAAAEEFGWSIPGQKGKRRQYLVMEEQHAI
jgi:hypothetical protein